MLFIQPQRDVTKRLSGIHHGESQGCLTFDRPDECCDRHTEPQVINRRKEQAVTLLLDRRLCQFAGQGRCSELAPQDLSANGYRRDVTMGMCALSHQDATVTGPSEVRDQDTLATGCKQSCRQLHQLR
jgi:hypothetical protein